MEFGRKEIGLGNKAFLNRIYEFDSFLLDPKRRRLFRNGEVVPLTAKLFDILLLLVSNDGEVVTKEELMKEIWQEQFVEDNNLTVSISAIRKALGVRHGERKYIETVPKYGYRFAAKVKELQSTQITAYQNQISGTKAKENIEPNSLIKTLAVLPFVNETGDSNLDYISDGLTESAVSNLSRIPQLGVLSQNIVSRYKGRDLDLERIGQELNVQVLLSGRVFQLNSNLSIKIELVDTENGFLLYAETYNLILSGLLNVQERMIAKISERLGFTQITLNKFQPLKKNTKNSEAYHLYLKGRHFMLKRSIKAIEKAIDYFNQALKLDKDYSLAYSGLADCYSILVIYGAYSPQEGIPKAKTNVLRALEIDDTLAEAHTSLAKIKVNFDWNWSEAEKEYQKAIELNPNYVPAYQWYAEHAARAGLFDKAIETVNTALELDAFSLPVNKSKVMILYLAKRYEEAVEECFEALENEPNYSPLNGLLGYIYIQQQRYEEAISVLRALIRFITGDNEILSSNDSIANQFSKKRVAFSESDPEAIGALGYAYAKADSRDEAIELVKGLQDLSTHRYVEPHALAMIYIGLGDYDRAMKWLEESFVQRSHFLTYLKILPLFDPLRDDARFVDLQKRVCFQV
jgi:DNA-binding winged helix-turn-helix (wHTH) protein/tetratricopeptide (TPR) repeat protein